MLSFLISFFFPHKKRDNGASSLSFSQGKMKTPALLVEKFYSRHPNNPHQTYIYILSLISSLLTYLSFSVSTSLHALHLQTSITLKGYSTKLLGQKSNKSTIKWKNYSKKWIRRNRIQCRYLQFCISPSNSLKSNKVINSLTTGIKKKNMTTHSTENLSLPIPKPPLIPSAFISTTQFQKPKWNSKHISKQTNLSFENWYFVQNCS